MRNMFDFLMQLLDSRASRMSPNQALLTLHADYIGGPHANYRKWYFAAQLDLDDTVGQVQNQGINRLKSTKRKTKISPQRTLDAALQRWRQAMNNMSQYDRLRQIALYLLCWGEAAQVRFVPECLCFIFKCADDYYRSPECQSRVDPVPEGLYLRAVTKPLYRFIRDQGYEVQDGKFVRREKDHHEIIGYDDINQLFWYPEGISRIVLSDKVRSPVSLDDDIIDDLYPDKTDRCPTRATIHEVRPDRLEPSILQELLRETFWCSSPRQLQSCLDPSRRLLLVLHGIQLAHHLPSVKWSRTNTRYGLVCYCTGWGGRDFDYDCGNSRRICVHPDHLEQHFAPRATTSLPCSLPLPYRSSNHLRRHPEHPGQQLKSHPRDCHRPIFYQPRPHPGLQHYTLWTDVW
jgi:hypothetical protein